MKYAVSSETYTSKLLTTSTAHIPLATQKSLVVGLEGVTYTPTDGGWLFNLEDRRPLPDHTDLQSLIQFAIALKYHYLMLDGDGPKMPEGLVFPVYSW